MNAAPQKIAEKSTVALEQWVWEARLPGRLGVSRNDLRGLRQRMLVEGVDWRREGGDENGRIEISATGLARLESALALCGPEKSAAACPEASCAAETGVQFVDPAHLVRAGEDGLVELVCVRGYTIRNPKLIEARLLGRGALASARGRALSPAGSPDLPTVLVRVRDNSNFGPGMRFLARREAERMFVFEQGLGGHPEKAGPRGKLPRVRGRW